MLWLEQVDVDRSGLPILRQVTLEVRRNAVTALIGANGAGKTTTLMAISGLLRCRRGRILFQEEPGAPRIELSGLPAHRVVTYGIAHCPEGRQIFAGLSVRENLLLGAHPRDDRDELAHDLEQVLDLFPILRQRQRQPGRNLSGGEQMMLAIGRALMARPRLLLLDEPSLGLAPRLVDQLFDLIQRLCAGGTTILLVEQNAAMALEIAAQAYVLEAGRVALAGRGSDLVADLAVRDAYLGAA